MVREIQTSVPDLHNHARSPMAEPKRVSRPRGASFGNIHEHTGWGSEFRSLKESKSYGKATQDYVMDDDSRSMITADGGTGENCLLEQSLKPMTPPSNPKRRNRRASLYSKLEKEGTFVEPKSFASFESVNSFPQSRPQSFCVRSPNKLTNNISNHNNKNSSDRRSSYANFDPSENDGGLKSGSKLGLSIQNLFETISTSVDAKLDSLASTKRDASAFIRESISQKLSEGQLRSKTHWTEGDIDYFMVERSNIKNVDKSPRRSRGHMDSPSISISIDTKGEKPKPSEKLDHGSTEAGANKLAPLPDLSDLFIDVGSGEDSSGGTKTPETQILPSNVYSISYNGLSHINLVDGIVLRTWPLHNLKYYNINHGSYNTLNETIDDHLLEVTFKFTKATVTLTTLDAEIMCSSIARFKKALEESTCPSISSSLTSIPATSLYNLSKTSSNIHINDSNNWNNFGSIMEGHVFEKNRNNSLVINNSNNNSSYNLNNIHRDNNFKRELNYYDHDYDGEEFGYQNDNHWELITLPHVPQKAKTIRMVGYYPSVRFNQTANKRNSFRGVKA